MKVELREITLPDFGLPVTRPKIEEREYVARCDALYRAADTDWVAVYGDREHFANLVWLTGYDPRFEEALLVLGTGGVRALLVGIEGIAYGEVAGLPLDIRLYHPFSIIGQPHTDSPPLRELLSEIGIRGGHRVSVAGWKTADPRDLDPRIPAFIPALLVRVLDELTGTHAVDITRLLINPDDGFRTNNSADQIAQFEWGASRASAAVLRVVTNVKPGMTELEAAGLMRLQAEPATMHPIVSSNDGTLNGLRSAGDRVIRENDGITVGVGLWGGLCCRAGAMITEPDEPFWTNLVEPYFRAIAGWWSLVGIGVTGGELAEVVQQAIGDAPFESFVNAGHLTSHDEWLYGFPVPGNQTKVRSGMQLQCDVIPTPLPKARSINCEDSLAIADEQLRSEIESRHPEVWARIEARRAFMRDSLGIAAKPEVLPVSVAPAYLPPAWLRPNRVCVAVS